MAIPVLPTDIILVILKYIGVQDLMRLRQVIATSDLIGKSHTILRHQTCKDFLEITQLRSVWYELIQSEVIQRNIPVPRLEGRNLDALTSKELEICLSDALRLRKNWISPSPVPRHRTTFRTVHQPQTQIVSVGFLPGRGHRWLISLALTTGGQRLFTLQCWDLRDSSCVAQRSLSDFRGYRINTESSPAAVLALRSPIGIEILGLDLSGGSNPDSAFITLHVLDNVPDSLHVFSGSTLLTKLGDARINLRTIDKPNLHVELRNPAYAVQKDCIDALLSDKYAVVVRTLTLEFYSLCSFRDGSADQILEPVCAYAWQWRVDSVSLAYQPSWEAAARGVDPPINILVRYASLFPWPVNALHHYVLPPDGSYNPRDGIDANNKPYLPEAVLIRTFASPIRLFARWDMVLGSYGTALWIDSHTEDYFDHAEEGQRLAGTLFTTIEPGEPTVALTDQTATATASMVYHVREDDGWVRIAIEEQEGKIAVGTATAEITIYEYV
ncbi:hypothetical protein C8R46DRAFT_1189877 [Mycena filopes]|nr:hypothetical protein C8R46DRAFT_1189877 [Mycena filopes]